MCGWRWKRVEVKSSVLDVLSQRVNEQKVRKKRTSMWTALSKNVHVQGKAYMILWAQGKIFRGLVYSDLHSLSSWR